MAARRSLAFAYLPGETCHLLYPTTLEEELAEGSEVVAHLMPNEMVTIVAVGNDATDRRVQVKTKNGGKQGWISVETEQGIKILSQDNKQMSGNNPLLDILREVDPKMNQDFNVKELVSFL